MDRELSFERDGRSTLYSREFLMLFKLALLI